MSGRPAPAEPPPRLLPLGVLGQAVVTDPLVGTASGYALVAASPGLAAEDAELLERQPLVTDYLHLLAEKRSFFAYHPLPSGAWALTRRFLHGTRRGAFNRVVAHALVLPNALREQLDDPPLTLRAHALLGEQREPWVRLGDRLAEELVFAGALLPLPELKLLVPEDAAEQRIAAVLAQRENLLAAWGPDRFQEKLERAFAALAHGRLLLAQGPQEEQFLALLESLLPWRDRCRLAFTSHLAIEALRLFRLAAIESPDAQLGLLPAGHGTFTLDAPPGGRVAGAAALAELGAHRELLARWLRRERAQGVSLFDDGAGLEGQLAFLLGGELEILGGFATWEELRRFLERVGLALHGGGAGGAFRQPELLLAAVVATWRRRLAAEKTADGRRIALDCLEVPRLVDVVLAPAVVQAALLGDPGGLGEAGRVLALDLALAARRPARADLEAWWPLLPAGRWAAGDPLEKLRRELRGRLARGLAEAGSALAPAALEALAEDQGLDPLAAEKQGLLQALAVFELAGRRGRPDLQRGLAERLLAPAFAAGETALGHDPAAASTLAAALAAALRESPRFPELAARLFSRLAGEGVAEIEPYAAWLPALEGRLPPAAAEALVAAWLPRLEILPAHGAGERLVEILGRLAAPRQEGELAKARERRLLRHGRTTAEAVLERLLEGAAAGDPTRFAAELEGQLGHDPARRLEEGLGLLRSPAISQRAKFLMEGPFLERLLAGAGARLGELLPPFAEIVAHFGSHAQLRLAHALGEAGRGREPLPTDFLAAALAAARCDLAGAFLRAAGPGYLRRLDRRRHRELIRALRSAWRRPAARLDLAPFGEAIARLEERR